MEGAALTVEEGADHRVNCYDRIEERGHSDVGIADVAAAAEVFGEEWDWPPSIHPVSLPGEGCSYSAASNVAAERTIALVETS